MTAHIFDKDNRCVGTGQNLAIIFRYALRMQGVTRITVDEIEGGRALVNVHYKGGWRGCTNFVSYSHACDWARDRSNLSPRVSWFAGCAVVCNPQPG
jgi:hypothetical protein